MLRDAFFHPAPPAVELRAFTHGLMPRTVPTMMQAFTDDWRTRGVDAWNEVPDHWGHGRRAGWWTLPDVLGDAFLAPLIGAATGTTIHVPNVHAAVSGVLTSPEVWARGRRLVTTAGEFPSVLHAAHRWSALLGFETVVVPPTMENYADVDRLMEEAAQPGTALVAVSHVGFTTGERLPDTTLRMLAETVHATGGLLLVDGYHATGSLAVQVDALGCDLYTGGLLKEACGSTGNAYLYVRPGLDLTPAAGGWFGDADAFGFGPAPTPHPEVRRRFLGGTTAIASFYHAVEGVRLLLEAGLPNVEAHVADLTAHAVAHADTLGLRLVTPRDPARRGALMVLEVEAANALSAYLKTQYVYTYSRRDRVLRFAPFVWNDRADLDRLFEAVSGALRSGTYRSYREETAGPVT
ncbi:MAG TPA: aminotransferase class V-fold PLP-dependent enzyme [Rhodothermales bacterium]|nr:aminotransferase class V-fold PLP-dependent enzyme [Rhodothermales bacterium]